MPPGRGLAPKLINSSSTNSVFHSISIMHLKTQPQACFLSSNGICGLRPTAPLRNVPFLSYQAQFVPSQVLSPCPNFQLSDWGGSVAFLGRHTLSCRDLCFVFQERRALALNREEGSFLQAQRAWENLTLQDFQIHQL